ncbi:NAD(P)-binding domain-containing protein [Microvirga sp. STR05]|uniref:NAD(P)-binding domain-containing protein n=1 Tax=Hymenobacter duratus TaxID=2771356 RepID=A0ABR8JBQ2_9BACT|nr:NAD(P)/FAD-dependent oxidoreductase [Hymenobacter duratus]MBD2714154.1 NAD(P)-binding domain-containing protein [Hymenobacter duratus]MBR7949056.1 NAD(P)-binding domain-containing protein [Microvirga sp. STR05]
MTEFSFDTLVIGAGQAGLAAAYYLQQRNIDFLLLEERAAVGDVWASRFDALRLFSPRWASSLPGLPWPGSALGYPTKDEAAAYLRQYAAHFRFPIHTGQRAVSLAPATVGNGYTVQTATGQMYQAQRVIVSTGAYSVPRIPDFAARLPTAVQQLHSSHYHSPQQIAGTGAVAVVGSGNSALQIAADLAATTRSVYAAFDDKTPSFPNNQATWALLKGTGMLGISRYNALGRYAMLQPEPVVRGDLQRLRRFPNAQFIGRASSSTPAGGLQGQRLATPPLEAIVWATGFGPGFDWIKLPIFEADGTPRHHYGLTEARGIAFLGLPWLNSRSSALMGGAGPDARHVVAQLLGST